MSLNSVERALNSSSDGPGSNLGGLNSPLALKQAAKFWSHTKKNFTCHLAQLVGRWTRVQIFRVQTSVGSILGWLWSKRPSVGLIPKKIFFICHLAQLVERRTRIQTGSILGWLWSKRPNVGEIPKKIFIICHLAQLVERWIRVQIDSILGWLWSKRPSVGLISKNTFSYVT